MLETLVATAIAAVVVVAALRASLTYQRNSEVEVANANRDILFSALNSFYGEHCRDPVKPQPTLGGLRASGYLLDNTAHENPLGGDYRIAISWGPPSRLAVRSNLPTGAAQGLENSLGPTFIVGTEFVWRRGPEQYGDQHQVFESEFVAAYGGNCE